MKAIHTSILLKKNLLKRINIKWYTLRSFIWITELTISQMVVGLTSAHGVQLLFLWRKKERRVAWLLYSRKFNRRQQQHWHLAFVYSFKSSDAPSTVKTQNWFQK